MWSFNYPSPYWRTRFEHHRAWNLESYYWVSLREGPSSLHFLSSGKPGRSNQVTKLTQYDISRQIIRLRWVLLAIHNEQWVLLFFLNGILVHDNRRRTDITRGMRVKCVFPIQCKYPGQSLNSNLGLNLESNNIHWRTVSLQRFKLTHNTWAKILPE